MADTAAGSSGYMVAWNSVWTRPGSSGLEGMEPPAGVTWRDAAHPDVAAQLPQLLPPALQQPRHRELGGGVEPGLCCYVTVTSLHQEMGVWVVVMT